MLALECFGYEIHSIMNSIVPMVGYTLKIQRITCAYFLCSFTRDFFCRSIEILFLFTLKFVYRTQIEMLLIAPQQWIFICRWNFTKTIFSSNSIFTIFAV